MKKWLCALLLVLFVCMLFASCGKDQPLRVCVDIPWMGEEDFQQAARALANSVADRGGPTDMEIELIPTEENDRKMALTRLRTEIMAGQGPDIFIVDCRSTLYNEMLFRFVETVMENNLFLPLDRYIEDARFMEWEKLTPSVMELGRNEHGQVILPMAYSLPMTVYRKDEVAHEPSQILTWQDMVADQSQILTANLLAPTEGMSIWGTNFAYSLGELADYAESKLLFTEEELQNNLQAMLAIEEKERKGELSQIPDCFLTNLGVAFNDANDIARASQGNFEPSRYISDFSWGDAATPITMVPFYSDDGGYCATVTSYAAVNANTKRPEDAFFVLDYLLSKEGQQYSELYNWITEGHEFPTYEGLGTEDDPIRTIYHGNWFMSDENYEEFCRVRDGIGFVRFSGTLDKELAELYTNCSNVYFGYDSGDIGEIIHEAYRVMNMEIAE